jgi:hypothetical protein
VNGLSDFADLHFVAGKMSQSPNCERLPWIEQPSQRQAVELEINLP